VANVAAPILFDVRVDAVDRTGVIVVQPCRKQSQPAQFSPTFVREDVVGIIRATAVEHELTNDLPGHPETRQRSDRAIGALWLVSQPPLNFGLLDGHTGPGGIATQGARRDHELIGTEVDDEILRNVVPDRVEQLGRDQLHGGRQLGIRHRIELDHVFVAAGISNAELGRDPNVRASGDEPLSWRRTVNLIRTTEDVVHRHVVPSDAIGEPAGIGHLAKRVDVECGPERASCIAERVDDELVALRQVVFRGLGGHAHVLVVPQRIVAVEAFDAVDRPLERLR
jgi:hypothetical protein